MNLYVYPTDETWFRFLQARHAVAPLDEVNFWQPGGNRAFDRLRPGELFLFRLKSPINMIAGGGVFTHGSVYPLLGAWEAFGEKNGTLTYERLFALIDGYRRKNNATPAMPDTRIGCIILQSPFFLPRGEWIPVPDDFHLNLVQGRPYDALSGTGAQLMEWAAAAIRSFPLTHVAERPTGPVYFEEKIVRRRLGQGAFRLVVSDAYERRCAVTGEKTLPVLEAAHIRPVAHGGQHRVDNGLLLRSDLHRLFDLGYLTVSSAGELRVSPKLKHEWNNGRIYYDLERSQLRLPTDADSRPSKQFLEWHSDTLFRP